MTLMEADKIIAGMYPKDYRSLMYERTVHRDGEIETDCHVYISQEQGPIITHKGHTWQEVIDDLIGAAKIQDPPEN